jgi:hypothetical protein
MSAINYSPRNFENILKNPKINEKINDFRHTIFLSERKEIKNKKKNRINNLILMEKMENKNNNRLQPFLKLLKYRMKQKNKIALNSGKNQRKENSTSTNQMHDKQIRDSNIDNKIIINLFTNKKKMFRPPEIKFLNNNLNIIYSENDLQFDKKYLKHINKKDLRGLALTHINSTPEIIKKNLNTKINLIKDRLSLIKSIVDFAYPELIIRSSMKQSNYFIKKFKLNIIPYKSELIKNKAKEEQLNNYYSSLLEIYNSKKG